MTDCKMRRQACSCVNTPLTVVAIQALLKTAHKQQWKEKMLTEAVSVVEEKRKCCRRRQQSIQESSRLYVDSLLY